ncbi:MAG: Hydrolase, haloacid dehalogenase-like family [Labilithrix sp.]|nr:Hydrolase, haloacid dehalogenase-like family [Labilithrix sp.]
MRTTRPTVYLWDIDGTLISTGGAGRRSMEGAFRDLHGEAGVRAIAFPFAGMTDQRIVRDGLAALEHHAPSAADIEQVLERYLVHLAEQVARADTYTVHRGVPEALALLARHESVAIGLGTGNIKKGAYAKLARGALSSSFAFGGFGCDAEDRTELLRVGATRGAALLGIPLAECRVVVIGDTPKDVAAAQGIGAECIAVGTGGFEPAALAALGARAAFATLDEDGVHAALLGD